MATAITRTKKYKALLALGLSPEDAAAAYRRSVALVADPVAQLVTVGLTPEQAQHALDEGGKPDEVEPVSIVTAALVDLLERHGHVVRPA